ncbi:transposase [Rhizobium lusitanum]|uniref:transposase n=1 Tax=Rhizobium lusitanum TaxID=293958 RepID=UPI003D7C2F29
MVASTRPPAHGVSRARTCEHSSCPKIRRRGITKAGNARVRRLLVESAWTYCRSPRVSEEMQRRQEGLDLSIVKIA